jgi:hypothetical protein
MEDAKVDGDDGRIGNSDSREGFVTCFDALSQNGHQQEHVSTLGR